MAQNPEQNPDSQVIEPERGANTYLELTIADVASINAAAEACRLPDEATIVRLNIPNDDIAPFVVLANDGTPTATGLIGYKDGQFVMQFTEENLDVDKTDPNEWIYMIDRFGIPVAVSDAIDALVESDQGNVEFSGKLSYLEESLRRLVGYCRLAMDQSPWAGDKLQGHQQLMQKIKEFSCESMTIINNEKNRENPKKVKYAALEEATSALIKLAASYENVEPLLQSFRNISDQYRIVSLQQTDVSELDRLLIWITNAQYEGSLTVSDVLTKLDELKIRVQESRDQAGLIATQERYLKEDLRVLQGNFKPN